MARANGTSKRTGKGRPQEYDYVAIAAYFAARIDEGLSIGEIVGKGLPFLRAELGSDKKTLVTPVERMKGDTAARMYRAVRPDPEFSAAAMAPNLPPEVAVSYAHQAFASATFLGRPIRMPAGYIPTRKPRRGRPRKMPGG